MNNGHPQTITSRGVTFLRPTRDEKHEQADICILVETLGGRVGVLGTRRARVCHTCGAPADQATRQTPGLPDLAIYLPPPPPRELRDPWVFLWVECKGKGGTLTPEQVEFKYLSERAGVVHLVGGLDAFLAWLRVGGWVR